MRRLILVTGAVLAMGAALIASLSALAGSVPSNAAAGRGAQIAFTRMRLDSQGRPQGVRIYVMNPDGSGQRRLTPMTTKGADDPAWSPDRRMIVFSRSDVSPSSDSQVYQEIHVMNASGGGERTLTRSAGGDSTPAWSPDGRKIAFARSGINSLGSWIFSMSRDGTGVRRLTPTGGGGYAPAWSPDGRRIAFTYDRGLGGNDFSQVYVMNADGSGMRRLTRAAADDGSPAWSPDGRRIAFSRRTRNGDAEIYVMNADGRSQRNLSRNAADDQHPTWSPDGRKIAFSRGTYGHDFEIYVMSPDGSGQRNLTRSTATLDANPAWSP